MSTKGDNYKASGNEGKPGANRWRADTHLLPSCSDVNIQVTARTAHHTYLCLPPAGSILPCKSDAPRWAPVHHQQWAGWSSLPAWLVFWQRAVTCRDVPWRGVTYRDVPWRTPETKMHSTVGCINHKDSGTAWWVHLCWSGLLFLVWLFLNW